MVGEHKGAKKIVVIKLCSMVFFTVSSQIIDTGGSNVSSTFLSEFGCVRLCVIVCVGLVQQFLHREKSAKYSSYISVSCGICVTE